MFVGLMVGLGIIVACALIPIAHFVLIPASPFIAGYWGISFAPNPGRHYALHGLIYGSLLGLLAGLVGVVIAVVVILLWGDDSRVRVLAWIGAGVFTLYTGSMATMGAMYAALREQDKAKQAAAAAAESESGAAEPWAALLLDLDGTLIAAADISPRVMQAVRQVDDLIPVTLSSGRRSADVIRYARQLGLTAPQISNGGATLLDPADGRILWNRAMPPERAREIIDRLAAESVNFIATHPAGDAETLAAIAHWDLTRISAMDIPESRADDLTAAFADCPALNVVKVYLHYNGWWAVDFTAAGVDKGTAALELARRMGVSPQQFIAAGDSYNDLPLLNTAGRRIVMAAAPPELRELAHYIAPPVEEDGLAAAIEDWVLPQLLGR